MFLVREVRDVEGLLVAAVQNAVEDNHLLDTVQSVLLLEAFPRRFCDDAFAAEGVQIKLDGIVRWCKHCVMTASRQQLHDCRVGIRTDRPFAKQTHILTIICFILQILRDGLPLENVS